MIKGIEEIKYLTEIKLQQAFAEKYVLVRKKEGRLLTDEQLLTLPDISKKHPNYREWLVRKKSAGRFISYLKNKENQKLSVMELGCGNGWFTNLIAQSFPSFKICGIDINENELIQANRVFKRLNLEFIYCDIFNLNSEEFDEKFDLIVLNASVQYFNDFELLIAKLKRFLRSGGEIHIMDSPFYKRTELVNARIRSSEYYNKIGFPEMTEYYHHHSVDLIKDFEVLYNPSRLFPGRIFRMKDSPFMWIKVR